jgi:Mrp family chromosome partitioning ATPase
VILTAPPLSEGYEGVELAQAADMVLPVIEAETTRKPVLQSLLTQLQDAGAIVLGAILLGRRSHIPPVVYRLLIERKWRG